MPVAVIIPVYNQARWLAEAIESAGEAEIIVVDDGSQDNAAEVVARYSRVKYLWQPNRGPSAARNAGIAASTAPLLVFLDGDDRMAPGGLEAGEASLAEDPKAVFSYGGFRLMDEDGHPYSRHLYTEAGPDSYDALVRRGNYIGMLATVMFRREPLVATGGFDPSLRKGEDYELYLRLTQQHNILSHPALVAYYRQHRAANSANRFAMLAACDDILDRQKSVATSAAIAAGKKWWRHYYANEIFRRGANNILRGKAVRASLGEMARAFIIAPRVAGHALFAGTFSKIRKRLTRRL